MKDLATTHYRLIQEKILSEGRLWLIASFWIALFVLMNRCGWKNADERQQLQQFSHITTEALAQFEQKSAYWNNISKRLTVFTHSMSPAELRSHLGTWSALFEHQPEWLATHIVMRRQGFEANIAATMLSSKAMKQFTGDKDVPIPWSTEVQANALQLISTITGSQHSNMSYIRSLRPKTQWLQIAHKTKSPNSSWSTWIVHTFSEELVPTLQADQGAMVAALYQPEIQKFLFSGDFSSHKIEASELKALMSSFNTDSGAQEHKFAMSRKSVWIAWQKSKATNAYLIQITPLGKIPGAFASDSPSFLRDWIFALIWLAFSGALLMWGNKQKLWHFSLEGNALNHLDHNKKTTVTKELNESPQHVREVSGDGRREFCQQLLNDFGNPGELRLAGNAVIRVETSPSANYKGSWWAIHNLDQERIFLAVGDASGAGLAALTIAYTLKYVLKEAVAKANPAEKTEILIQKLYALASASAESILLGSTHSSMFMAIIEPESKVMAFINAGYPPPELSYPKSKSIYLTPHTDPLGLGTDTQPRPRWVNLSAESQLTLCNIGCRNIDLNELDESELVKIFVYPLGCATRNEQQQEIELDVA